MRREKFHWLIQLFIPRDSKPCVRPFHPMETRCSRELAITDYFGQQSLGWQVEIDRA
jgi:hypothetical protein